MLLLGPLDPFKNQQETERDIKSLLPLPYRHGLSIEKIKQKKMNTDVHFLRVIMKDKVTAPFNNILFLGFVRRKKSNMKHILFQDITQTLRTHFVKQQHYSEGNAPNHLIPSLIQLPAPHLHRYSIFNPQATLIIFNCLVLDHMVGFYYIRFPKQMVESEVPDRTGLPPCTLLPSPAPSPGTPVRAVPYRTG